MLYTEIDWTESTKLQFMFATCTF